MKNNTDTLQKRPAEGLIKTVAAGMIFSLIFAAFTAISLTVCNLTGYKNIIIASAGVILAAPFYAGLVETVRRYLIENDSAPVIKTFFSAVRRKFLPFLLYGVTAYLVFCCSYFAVLYYYSLSRTDGMFVVLLAVYLVFASALLVMLFYLPIIGVSYDLKIRRVYGSSIKLIIKNAAPNLLVLILTAVTSAAFIAFKILSGVSGYAVLAAAIAVCPTVLTYLAVRILSPGIQELLGIYPNMRKPEAEPEIPVISTDNTEDDYIFINGKIIKNPNKKKSEDNGQ